MLGKGRQKIYTDVAEVNESNVIEVLRDAILTHTEIASECNELINFVAGIQPLQRIKTYRPDINIEDIDNVADEITNFKTSFNWGNPITLVQHGENDGGTKKESEAISALNACFDAENNKRKTQELANFVEKCGIGYTYIDINTEYEDGDSYFKYMVLDPRSAFVVRTNYYPDHRVVMNVTFRVDKVGNRYYTVFTKDRRFEITNKVKKVGKDTWDFGEGNNELNPLGRLPFTEWIRCSDRTGCFERQIPTMNALNILESDYANSVDQNTQAIWLTIDVDFPTEIVTDEEGNEKEVVKHPKSNDWFETYSNPDGKQPSVTPLSIQTDYAGMLNNYLSKRALILQKCNVPSRDSGANKSGIAVSDSSGWTQAEVEATQQDQLKSDFKLDEVKIALTASKLCSGYKGEFGELKYSDVTPNIKRQKNYELINKVNAFATAVAHGLDYRSVLKTINLFDDPQQVAKDSEETMQMYLDKTFSTPKETEKETKDGLDTLIPDRLEQDNSDQTDTSPTLDKSRA